MLQWLWGMYKYVAQLRFRKWQYMAGTPYFSVAAPLFAALFMKFQFLLIGCLLLVCSSLLAQVGFGVEGGMGMATMRFAPSLYPIRYTSGDASAIAGYKVGAFVDVPLQKRIYFQSGLLYARKGAVKKFGYYFNDSFNTSVSQGVYLHYIDLPIQVLFKSGQQGKGRFTLGLGAVLAYAVGGHTDIEEHLVYNDTPYVLTDYGNVREGNVVRNFEASVHLTAGYEMPTGLFFRGYYTAAITDIGLNSEILKNRALGLSVGYIFGKGRNINKEADLIDKDH